MHAFYDECPGDTGAMFVTEKGICDYEFGTIAKITFAHNGSGGLGKFDSQSTIPEQLKVYVQI